MIPAGKEYAVHHGDCIEHMATMPAESVDFVIYSPPFPAVFSYTEEECDIGNSEDINTEALLHLSFFYRQLARVVKPGRVVMVHVTQIPRMKRDGDEGGLYDFRGLNIKLGCRSGLIYDYDWLIGRNPQAQAIRTKSRCLQFAGLESDRAQSRGALGDYLIKFRVPGENKVPVNDKDEVGRNDWIQWASAAWIDIRETHTLNVKGTKGENDTRHVCVARGTLVLTRDGYKPIETVEIGEKVLTHMGRWRPVLAKVCNGVRSVVQTEAQGVADLRTTPDHLLWTRKGSGPDGGVSHPRKCATRNAPDWMPAAEAKGSYVGLPLPPVESSPYSADDWWLVGYWLGNGHFDARGHMVLSCHHDKADWLKSKLGQRSGCTAVRRTATQIAVKDPDGRVRGILSRCGRGAAGKFLSQEAMSLNPALAESLLSGYLAADGHYVEKYQRWTASSVSRPLLLGMALLAQRVYGVAASVYAGRSPGTAVIEGRTVNTLQHWVLSIPPRNVSAMLLDDVAWKKVRKVESAGEAEVWDITVAEDQSFVAEGCVVHNCPLQLDTIERLVRLYTNRGEVVFSPFAGIGSEGYVALRHGRRFYGCELKDEYYRACLDNLDLAIRQRKASSRTLFSHIEEPAEVPG